MDGTFVFDPKWLDFVRTEELDHRIDNKLFEGGLGVVSGVRSRSSCADHIT